MLIQSRLPRQIRRLFCPSSKTGSHNSPTTSNDQLRPHLLTAKQQKWSPLNEDDFNLLRLLWSHFWKQLHTELGCDIYTELLSSTPELLQTFRVRQTNAEAWRNDSDLRARSLRLVELMEFAIQHSYTSNSRKFDVKTAEFGARWLTTEGKVPYDVALEHFRQLARAMDTTIATKLERGDFMRLTTLQRWRARGVWHRFVWTLADRMFQGHVNPAKMACPGSLASIRLDSGGPHVPGTRQLCTHTP